MINFNKYSNLYEFTQKQNKEKKIIFYKKKKKKYIQIIFENIYKV